MEPIAATFRRFGVRLTKPRAAVYLALASTKSHPTAEELYDAARASHPGLSLATVYNSLELFCRRGLARKITSLHAGGSVARYDADLSRHAHFISAEGLVRDVPGDLSTALLDSLPPEVIDAVERRLGVRVDRVSIELFGSTTSGGPC